jgi:hypothetical protein
MRVPRYNGPGPSPSLMGAGLLSRQPRRPRDEFARLFGADQASGGPAGDDGRHAGKGAPLLTRASKRPTPPSTSSPTPRIPAIPPILAVIPRHPLGRACDRSVGPRGSRRSRWRREHPGRQGRTSRCCARCEVASARESIGGQARRARGVDSQPWPGIVCQIEKHYPAAHLMRLPDFILGSIDRILAEWERFARSIWPGQVADPAELRDDAEALLHAIVADMQSAQTAADQASKSKGHGPDGAVSKRVDNISRKHAIDREGSGFELAAVVAEYRALRVLLKQL